MLTKDDIRDVELDLDGALKAAIRLIGFKQNHILDFFDRSFHYCDEPQFYKYNARVHQARIIKEIKKPTRSTGISFISRKAAALRCLGEAVERYTYRNFKSKNIIFARGKELDYPFLPVNTITSFSKKQRAANPYLKLDPAGKYGWVLGYRLPDMQPTYLPAQAAYVYYKRFKGEDFIQIPISTGAASGTAYSGALYRGLCEVVERDAFMIMYLNKLPCPSVDLHGTTNQELLVMLKTLENYNLKLQVYDCTNDLAIPSFAAIIEDQTGIGPAITVGLKSHIDPVDAIVGAANEAFTTRKMIREVMDSHTATQEELLLPVDTTTRGILWSTRDTAHHLDFLLHSKTPAKRITDYADYSALTIVKRLDTLLERLDKQQYPVYFADLTGDLPHKTGEQFKVVMTIVPDLHPLYLNERFRYFGGRRLYEVPVSMGYRNTPISESKLNDFPHPFL